jgi:hypothetical protein
MRILAFALTLATAFATGCGPDGGNQPSDLASPADLLMAGEDLGGAPDMAEAGTDLLSPDLAGSNQCNFTISNPAAVVQQTMVAQPMPTATSGGSIAAGTYYLTDSKIYQGAPAGTTPHQLQVTQIISGSSVQVAQYVVGSANTVYDYRNYSTSSTTLTITFPCGSGSAMLGFDATPTQYTTYNYTGMVVNVYTKQ